jgi:EAL domain-containing protein (putative c-di-GMP-specific phosphodiesterase class I)/glycosyltransferase involved in cell wall biosynthesis
MNLLFLAPQPFFGERGTPIAVDLVLKVLSERDESVDVVVYHVGEEVSYPNTRVFRTHNLPFIRTIPPGFSWKKVVCDIFMLFLVLSLVRKKRYHLVHAVEESVFIAVLLKLFYKIPYIYDMDSSLAEQMVEKHRWLELFFPVLSFFEGLAVRQAKAVVPVCEALRLDIEKYRPEKVVVLWDVSLLRHEQYPIQEDLRARLAGGELLAMYVGNLEGYQGIDLLLDSFELALKQSRGLHLAVIGGKEADILKYQKKTRRLKIQNRVFFLGPKPIASLSAYLSQADILVSPRIKGKNTPMKIYSYLASAKPVLATCLPTHTQVLSPQVAYLAGATPEAFAAGMCELAGNPELRERLGRAGVRLIEERHTYRVFRQKLNALYNWIKAEVDPEYRALPGAMQAIPMDLYERGIQPQELCIQYQPIVSLETGVITGFEALVRWIHPELGLVCPAEFISVAEDTGQIYSIGRYVLYEACRQMREWELQYPTALPLTICVNLSARQLQQPDLIEQIDQILEETSIDTQSLSLEISERAFAENEDAATIIYQLRARGVQLNIDYEGRDELSLDLLQGIPVNALKIDPSFVSGVELESSHSETVQKVIGLARSSGMDVVAVGVETRDQLKKVKELQCAYGQGFYFSKPLDSEAAGALISISGLGRLFSETDEQGSAQPKVIGSTSDLVPG